MIIIKTVPGLTTPEIMHAIADHVPLDQIETGYGGIVVDERTALVFLQRYLAAVDDVPASTNQTSTPEVIAKARIPRKMR
jgi:hypothetical protein